MKNILNNKLNFYIVSVITILCVIGCKKLVTVTTKSANSTTTVALYDSSKQYCRYEFTYQNLSTLAFDTMSVCYESCTSSLGCDDGITSSLPPIIIIGGIKMKPTYSSITATCVPSRNCTLWVNVYDGDGTWQDPG